MTKPTKPAQVVKVVEVAPAPKPWYDSKTLWLNVLALAPFALEVITNTNLIDDKDIYAIVVALLNIAIRFKTGQPIRIR